MIPTHETPFVTFSSVIPDRDGVEQLIPLLKATYDISPAGELTPAAEQDPIVAFDEQRGDPLASSILRETEVMPPKPLGTDVFLIGHALAPKPGTTQMLVRLRVGTVDKQALVLGPRRWRSGVLGGASHTDPEPFERLPLCYEHAFGGEDRSPEEEKDWEDERRNPIGRGFRAKKSRAEWVDTELPRIEDPAAPLRDPGDRPAPIGFGPIGRHWEPRIRYTGSYDQAWIEERAPLLPADFDERFHHAVPADQIVVGHLRGGEAVEIVGCTPSGSLAFAVPVLRPSARVRLFLGEPESIELRCDSLTLDTDRMKLSLVYKAAVPMRDKLLDVKDFSIGLEEAAP